MVVEYQINESYLSPSIINTKETLLMILSTPSRQGRGEEEGIRWGRGLKRKRLG